MIEAAEVRSSAITVEKSGENFRLELGGDAIRTPGGQIVEHPNQALIIHMMDELQEHPTLVLREGVIETPRFLNSYLIFSTQADFPEATLSRDADVREVVESDPLMNPSPGPEYALYQAKAWRPIQEYLVTLGIKDRKLWNPDDQQIDDVTAVVKEELKTLTQPEAAVFTNLFCLHGNTVLGALAFIKAPLTNSQFANAMAACLMLKEVLGLTEEDQQERQEQHKEATRDFANNARICREYLSFFEEKKPVPSAEEIWKAAEEVRSKVDNKGGSFFAHP